MFEYNRHRIDEIRHRMIDEYLLNLETPGRYVSQRLDQAGQMALDELVIEACSSRDEIWLARTLAPRMRSHTPANTRSGVRKVPSNASTTLADGIWNNLVCRAECCVAIETGLHVEVYRAGQRMDPRDESDILIGQQLEPAALLDDLRSDAVDPAGNRSAVPVGPNSGLSLRALELQSTDRRGESYGS